MVRDDFDVVQTLLRLPGHGPDEGVEHPVRPIPDGPLDGTRLAGVIRPARALHTDLIVAYLRAGLPTVRLLEAPAE